jgi:exosortase
VPARITFSHTAAGAAVWLAGFVTLYFAVLGKLWQDWAADPNYSHGFFVAPLAVLIAWDRRAALRAAIGRGSASGFVLVAGSLFLFLVGVLGAELFLTRTSMIGVIAGSVLFAFGWRMLRIAALPIAFLLLMIPPPTIVFNQIALPLQLLASTVGEGMLRLVGVAVFREGNVLVLPNVTLQVSEACSGIRSLVSLGTAAILYAYFMERRRGRRVILALSSVPIAIAVNALRVAATGVAAAFYGAEAAEGVLHTISGWLMFVAALVMLWALHQLMGRLPSAAPAPSLARVEA